MQNHYKFPVLNEIVLCKEQQADCFRTDGLNTNNMSFQFDPEKTINENDSKYNPNPSLQDRIHCLVSVLPADTVSQMDESMFRQMRTVREAARDLGLIST